MGRVACIDIGTVTCRLAVADVQGGRVQSLHRRSTIVDVGEDLTRTGVICEAAQRRLMACVDDYLEEARGMEAPAICCTLTSAARDASNSSELLAQLASRGLDAQVIPGEVEGSLTLLGVCQDFPGRLVLVADNGGGSTELALEAVEALADFVREIGLDSTFTDLGLNANEETLRKVADTCGLSGGNVRKLERDEVFELLKEVL